jgi:hypothetical protein
MDSLLRYSYPHFDLLMHNQSTLYTSLSTLLERQENLSHLLILWRTSSGNRVPTRACRESISTATRVAADGDIVEHFRMLVYGRVQETNGAFALFQSLFVE